MKKQLARKRGRPATGHTKQRAFGRVPDAQWEFLQQAAEKSGKTFTQWMISILGWEASKQLKRRFPT